MNRETLNLVFTILSPAILALACYAFNTKLDMQHSDLTAHTDAAVASLKQSITETYETQNAHAADMQKISDWTKSLQAGQTDQKLVLQHLTDVVSRNQP